MQLRRVLGQGRLVLLGRHEEDGGPGPLDGDRLLGHAAHVAHVALASMVPVAATVRLPVRWPPESLSMMPSVMESPADGPPMSAVCTVTLTGKVQDCWVLGIDAQVGRGLPASPHPLSVRPLGGVPRVILRCTIGPFTNAPDGLTVDCLDRERGRGPGRQPVQGVDQRAGVGDGVPLTAVMTCGHLEDVRGRGSRGDPEDQRAGVLLRRRVAEVGEGGRRGAWSGPGSSPGSPGRSNWSGGVEGPMSSLRRDDLAVRGEVALLEVGQGGQRVSIDVGEEDVAGERVIQVGRDRDERRHRRGVARE